MAILPIVKYPDELLRQVCEDVTEFNTELHTLLDDMTETMYAAHGVGLAAPQIGVLKRITVIDVSSEQNQPVEFINPEIITSEGSCSSEEGCLSIPEYRATIKRAEEVVVKAQNRSGEFFEVAADELYAIALQHEIDHLLGVLFVDKLSRLKKELFKKWYKKNAPL